MNNSLLELQERYGQEFIGISNHGHSLITEELSIVLRPKISTSPLVKLQNIALKRFIDVIIAIVAITFLISWLIPIVAILIKIDSAGPIFFIQKRNKKGGKFFYCLKLRTMIINADSDTLTATMDDKRITRIGRFLRKSHIDELPQFINVLIGDMSIVGPRPHMSHENFKYTSQFLHYSERHTVKPGITGLAQSLGYHGPIVNEDQLKKKIEYDIFYIQNWSLTMDLKILTTTLITTYKKIAYSLKY
jgi:putative colanic acid biosynthesis UDP-glucose lipid carrier transferase